MQNINEILVRAAALRDETALNSISPERAGGIMYDTLLALNELWLQQGAALVISKIYASVAAMEADTAPVSDLTGQPLRPGQIVVIASSDSDNGSVYRYNGTDSPSWSLVGEIGNLEPVDSLDSDSTQLPLAAHQGKVLDGKISQLGQVMDMKTPFIGYPSGLWKKTITELSSSVKVIGYFSLLKGEKYLLTVNAEDVGTTDIDLYLYKAGNEGVSYEKHWYVSNDEIVSIIDVDTDGTYSIAYRTHQDSSFSLELQLDFQDTYYVTKNNNIALNYLKFGFEYGGVKTTGELTENTVRVRPKPLYFSPGTGTKRIYVSTPATIVLPQNMVANSYAYLGNTAVKAIPNFTFDSDKKTGSFTADGTFDNIRFTMKREDGGDISLNELNDCIVLTDYDHIPVIEERLSQAESQLNQNTEKLERLEVDEDANMSGKILLSETIDGIVPMTIVKKMRLYKGEYTLKASISSIPTSGYVDTYVYKDGYVGIEYIAKISLFTTHPEQLSFIVTDIDDYLITFRCLGGANTDLSIELDYPFELQNAASKEEVSLINNVLNGIATHSYEGQEIRIANKYYMSLYKRLGATPVVQAMANYGDRLFLVGHLNSQIQIYVFSLTTGELISTLDNVNTGSLTNVHANVAFFGNEFYDSSSKYPLFYIDRWDGDRELLVYNISENEDRDTYGATLVQVITPSSSLSDVIKGNTDFIYDALNDKLFAISYGENPGYDSNLPSIVSKYAMPKIIDGANVTLSNYEDSFTIPTIKARQDMAMRNGKIYVFSNTNEDAALTVIDTTNKVIASKISIGKDYPEHFGEAEPCDIINDTLVVSGHSIRGFLYSIITL